MARSRRPPGLTEAERRLWQTMVRDATPLKQRRDRSDSAAFQTDTAIPTSEDKGSGSAGDDKQAPVRNPAQRQKPSRASAATAAPPPVPSLSLDTAQPGVDRRTSERLRKGKFELDGRIDLHGMTREQAHDAVVRFVESSHARGLRYLLIITGKGTFSEIEGGVLRRAVPRWLADRPLRDKVLSIRPAQKHHGGAGALYVLLRRERDRSAGRG